MTEYNTTNMADIIKKLYYTCDVIVRSVAAQSDDDDYPYSLTIKNNFKNQTKENKKH